MTRKYKPCERCGSRCRTSSLCYWCRRGDAISESVRPCALCGAEFHTIGGGRAGSPYCSRECASLVTEARVKVIAKVAAEVKRGRLDTPRNFRCVDCGDPAIHYEHRHYMFPLSVNPVCRSCNKKRGPANDIRELVAHYLGIDVSGIRSVIEKRIAERGAYWHSIVSAFHASKAA